jgi:hypothetical protein
VEEGGGSIMNPFDIGELLVWQAIKQMLASLWMQNQ